MNSIFLQGFIMGLAYVAPIGLQNLFVINTALTQSRWRSYLTAFIVIFFDITLALACFYGIGAVMERFMILELFILLLGSLIIIYIGISLIRSKGDLKSDTDTDLPIKKVAIAACVVTWFNPQAIIDGTLMLGAFRAAIPASQGNSFIAGVAAASFSWFFAIVTLISLFSARINHRILRYINILCGSVIIFYGLKLGLRFFQKI